MDALWEWVRERWGCRVGGGAFVRVSTTTKPAARPDHTTRAHDPSMIRYQTKREGADLVVEVLDDLLQDGRGDLGELDLPLARLREVACACA